MIQRFEVTMALKNMLVTVTGKQFGVLVAPANPESHYGIIYPIEGMSTEDDFLNSGRQNNVPYQITYVGQNYEQVERLATLIRAAVLDWAIPIPLTDGAKVVGRWQDTGLGTPDYLPASNLCSIPERFVLSVDAP